MSDFLPPRAAQRPAPDQPERDLEDPRVARAFADLARAETMFDGKRRFDFKVWHAVVFFLGLALMPLVMRFILGS